MTARRRILLAEDDDDLRELLQAWLGEEYLVVCVEDGFELLDYFSLTHGEHPVPPPDLIVSDVCMPGMSGIEVLNQLRGQHVDCPVVLMSAFADEKTRTRALESGATMFIEKPVDLAYLVETVRRLIPSQEPFGVER